MLLSSAFKPHKNRPLLVLDIDETLLYAATSPLKRRCDYQAQRTWIYKRPHVDTFLRFCAANFELAIWTAARRSYAEEVLHQVFNYITPSFVFCEQDCIAVSPTGGHDIAIKPLSRLRLLGYSLERVLVVDDTRENHSLNLGNLIHINPYRAERECHTLRLLQHYLAQIKDAVRLDTIDHRLWCQAAGAIR